MSSPSAPFASGPDETLGPVSVRDIRESPRRPGRYRLTLSDGRTLLLGVAALSAAGATRVGAILSAEALAGLERDAIITDLTDRAVGYLARGRRTRRELETRLRKREAPAALIAIALDRLEANGVLSDAEVARGEAAARLRRGEGPSRVRQRLRQKGMGDREAQGAIAEAVAQDGFDERAACMAAADKRARSLRRLEPDVARRRLTAFLLRRGFAGSHVRDAVKLALAGQGAHTRENE